MTEPIRKKLSSLLIDAAHKAIETLDLQASCVKQLSEIENLDEIIVEEIEIICKAVALTDNSKVFFKQPG